MKVQSRRNSSRKRLVHIVIISLFLIGVGMFLPRAVSIVSATVMYPAHSINIWLEESSALIPSFIRERGTLKSEIESLKNQLVIAERTDLTQQRLFEENDRLRHLLGINKDERVVAAVIARPDELPYDFLQIDRGSDHGIEVGSPVFVGQDIVIGLIVHVAPSYSFVELATTPGFVATAFIAGPNIMTKMQGFGGGIARISVPQGVPLVVGNLVYLPSVEPGVFGRISHVENRITQPEQYGYISPDISISSLFQVSVGKQSQISHSVSEIDEKAIELINIELLVSGAVGDISTTSTSTAVELSE